MPLRGPVAVLWRDSAQDGRVGAGVAMASDVLRLENGDGLIEFFGCFRLFGPDAVVLAGVSPSDQFRRDDVRHTATCALAVDDIEVAGCRLWVWGLQWFVRHEVAEFAKYHCVRLKARL